jgi:Kef-type K+ transport system membrane component KefB
MASVWLQSALWLGLALLASLVSIRVAVSVALVEIVVGAAAGNLIGLQITDWVNFLAGFGAILLTFLAGTEIDPRIVKKHFWSSMTIGVMGFLAPYLGVLAYAHFVLGWAWPQAQIAGISLSTTSVAVVYAVMIETGFNQTDIGKIILAACFINDLGTVLALGVVFAHYDLWLLLFGVVTAGVLVVLVRYAPWMFKRLGQRAHGAAWRKTNAGHVSLSQLKVMSAIETCRTAALGGHVERCEDCAYERVAYNSCRNRPARAGVQNPSPNATWFLAPRPGVDVKRQ